MINRDRLVQFLEPWKAQIPSHLLHSMIMSGEEDTGIKNVLLAHRWRTITNEDTTEVTFCEECRTPWPCNTAKALGIKW